MRSASTTTDVLTLEEVASYLRLPPEVIEREALEGQIPGRRIDDRWRFLKTAADEWLRRHDGRSIALKQFGALGDDESLDELRAAIYAARGRSEVEPGSGT
jgi:excisionase family DNA binding protein